MQEKVAELKAVMEKASQDVLQRNGR